MVLGFTLFFIVLTGLDLYAYQAVRLVSRSFAKWPRKAVRWGWWLWSALNLFLVIYAAVLLVSTSACLPAPLLVLTVFLFSHQLQSEWVLAI